MSKKALSEDVKAMNAQAAELTRRRCMLMAASMGVTQTGLSDALVNRHWEENFAGGPLDELLTRQLAKE